MNRLELLEALAPADRRWLYGVPERACTCGSMFKEHRCHLDDWKRGQWLLDHEREIKSIALGRLLRDWAANH